SLARLGPRTKDQKERERNEDQGEGKNLKRIPGAKRDLDRLHGDPGEPRDYQSPAEECGPSEMDQTDSEKRSRLHDHRRSGSCQAESAHTARTRIAGTHANDDAVRRRTRESITPELTAVAPGEGERVRHRATSRWVPQRGRGTAP